MFKPTAFILLFVFFSANIAFGQHQHSSSEEPFVKQAVTELNAAVTGPEGSLYKFAAEQQLHGTFTFDITIRGKGEVATVMVVSGSGGTLKMQNLLKDRLKVFRFSFKMPKGNFYKFQYTFQFN